MDAGLAARHQTAPACDAAERCGGAGQRGRGGAGRGRGAYEDRAAREVPFEDFAAAAGAEEAQGPGAGGRRCGAGPEGEDEAVDF